MLQIGMLTSGGDCQGLNAALRGVAKTLYNELGDKVTIYGIRDGYRGLIEGDYHEMLPEDFSDILTVGGTILGTSRQPFKEMRKTIEDSEETKLDKMLHTVKKAGFDCLVILGGNGTHKTANLLSMKGVNVVTLPKTIDNDLVLTDHTPGYGSAARYVAASVREIALDASVYQQKSVTIVEIMGRHAGWLTAASALARKEAGDNPLLIYLPEAPFELAQFNDDLKKAFEKTANVIVCVSEGIRDHGGRFICEYSTEAQVDTFGHKMLAGCGKILENYVRNQFGVKVRSVELNVNQRCSGLTVSGTDLNEAEMAGRFGVQAALDGHTGQMVAFERETDTAASEPVHAAAAVSNAADLGAASASCVKHRNTVYKIHPVLKDVNLICNQEKKVPAEWITKNGTDVSDDFLAYSQPLIQGDVSHIMENGLPKYLYRK